MNLTTKHVISLITAGALFIGILVGSVWFRPDLTTGSVSVSDEYNATSTAANTLYGATITGDKLVKTGPGAFGSVVLTGANTGTVNFYDATTTNVSLRTGNKATSTILLASHPASLAAGTYTYDVVFSIGLLIDLHEGTMPTSTVTYR